MTAEFKARQQERQKVQCTCGRCVNYVPTCAFVQWIEADEAEADVTLLIERLERAEKVIEASRKGFLGLDIRGLGDAVAAIVAYDGQDR